MDVLFRDVHRLAKTYHWSEPEILRLERPRRQRYLALLDEEENTQILAGMSRDGQPTR